jgi:transposase InsO family protein
LVPVQQCWFTFHRSQLAVAEGLDRIVRPRLGDELLNAWRLDSLLEARMIIEDWRRDYNANRPHSAHGELTPPEFALQWTSTHQPQAA